MDVVTLLDGPVYFLALHLRFHKKDRRYPRVRLEWKDKGNDDVNEQTVYRDNVSKDSSRSGALHPSVSHRYVCFLDPSDFDEPATVASLFDAVTT